MTPASHSQWRDTPQTGWLSATPWKENVTMTTKFTAKRGRKPEKPRRDFPLFPHATNRWAKKVRGKLRYFGKVSRRSNWPSRTGQVARPKRRPLGGPGTASQHSGRPRLRDLCNAFLSHKKALLEAGELCQRTFGEYFNTCDRLVKAFGRDRPIDNLIADDFRHLRDRSQNSGDRSGYPTKSNGCGACSSTVLTPDSWTSPSGSAPTSRKPSAKVLRKNRADAGSRMFEPEEFRPS